MLDTMNVYQRHLPPCPEKSKKVRCRKCTYYGDFRVEGLGIKSLKTMNQEQALKKAEFIVKTRTGVWKPISTAIQAWKNRLALGNVGKSTQYSYLRLIEKQLLPWCEARGYVTLERLTKEVIEEFRETKRNLKNGEPLAPTTVAKELEELKVFFGFLKQKGWIEVDPVAEVEPPITRDNEIVPYTQSEIVKIIAACELVRDPIQARALILTMRWTGMRISDAVALRRDNIIGSKLNIRTMKNDMHVRQKLHPDVLAALSLLPCADPDWQFYFVPKGWEYESAYAEARHLLDSVYRKSGVVNAKNHRFRHTFISVGLAAGTTEREMADMVGITESVLRKYYSKWMAEREERTDEASEKIFAFEKKRQERTIADSENGPNMIQ